MPAQEKFARGYEQYLLNGDLPESPLNPAFKEYDKWLKEVYNGANKPQKQPLTEDMVRFFNSMTTGVLPPPVKTPVNTPPDEELEKPAGFGESAGFEKPEGNNSVLLTSSRLEKPAVAAETVRVYDAAEESDAETGRVSRTAGIKMDGETFEAQTSPFQTPDTGNAIYHQKQIIDAEQKILRGDPFDAGVRRLRYIDEPIAAVMGKKPGYLQLKSSNVHPSEKHLKNIRDVGFSSVEDYSDFVARNFDGIYKGSSPGRYMFAVSSERLQQLNVHTNGHSNTLVVEAMLIKDSGIFDIITAFPKSKKFFEKRKNLLSERAQTNQTVSDSPGAYFGQKQALNNNITFDGRNVQPVKVDGYKITTQYDIVDLSELKTSDFPDFPDYPASLQPRDRSRQASADQVGEMMRRLDPERLGRHTDADRGAPIVSPDGFVESGNGRTAAIRRAIPKEDAAGAVLVY